MKTDYILFYFLQLVRKGWEWQNKDLNGSRLSRHGFSWLKLISVLLAGTYVVKCPAGMTDNKDIIDFVLSSLSITTALMFSIIVVVLDRARDSRFDSTTEKGQANEKHQWNHLYQFASLVSYAILWSLLVIVIMVSSMLFGHKVDLSIYEWCGFNRILCLNSWLLFIKCAFVAGVRFVMVYAIYNFFILFLYAVLSLFESICSELDIKKPNFDISEAKRSNPTKDLKREYGIYKVWLVKLLIALIVFMVMLYLSEKIK